MEKPSPLISCVLPVYNGGQHLKEAIESILSQTLGDFELILIDDGSKDGSLAVMQGFADKDARIRLISRPNKGLIKSLNEGIELSRGEFIARMDADDISLPRRFEKQARLLESGEYDICGCHYYHVDDQGKYLFAETVPLTTASMQVTLSCAVPFAHGSVMMRKSILDRLNLRYGLGNHRFAEDYSLWLSLYRGGARFGNVDDFQFKYRDAGESLSIQNQGRIGKDTRRLARAFISDYREELAGAYREQLKGSRSRKELELIVFSLTLNFLSRPGPGPLSLLRKLPSKAVFLGMAKTLRLYLR